jgi:glycosyltransferase involved in cell wall biosynthesis
MNRKLKIGIVVLPWIPLPPPGYAGTERIVYNLTEGLVKRGHDVTLFTTGDSQSSAHIESIMDHAMGLQEDVSEGLKNSFYPLMHVANAFNKKFQFDIIHSHAQFLGLPFGAGSETPSIHTFHREFSFTSQDERDIVSLYKDLSFTSISNAQRVPNINFISTIYNGVDINLYKPSDGSKKEYLFWAGRMIEKKGPKEAIQIAKNLHIPLIMAGAITEKEYFKKEIQPDIDGTLIKFVGEIHENEMLRLYQEAKITLVPIKWNEPFGLVPVESMATGTPVVAYSNGGVKETIIDGVTGYLIEESSHGLEALEGAVQRIYAMPEYQYKEMRHASRLHVENNFSIDKMVDGYEKVYSEIVAKE